jgi:ectoine hydroxylase-related dioxygenase (phytanoyl-CoA dioxygenase family)
MGDNSYGTTVTGSNGANGQTKRDLLAALTQDGFVLIRQAIKEPQLTQLREAGRKATEAARAGKWPYIRTLPKQFPPWSSDPSAGIWGVQHLMHPDMPSSQLFAESYFNDGIMDIVKELLSYGGKQCTDDDLVMELYNMLVRPDDDFELRWHRDDIPATATAEEELERLVGHEAWHCQWNLALYNDRSLVVVPKSHKRARTEEERNAHPYEKTITDMLFVEMQPGDVVFYDNNILHRGVYSKDVERMTLHGSVGHVKGKGDRARNVLQHGIGSWIAEADFSGLNDKTRTRAEGMRKRLFEIGQSSGEVVYSQPDTNDGL